MSITLQRGKITQRLSKYALRYNANTRSMGHILLIRATVLSDKPNMILQHVGYSYSKSNELVYSVFLILKKTLFVNKAKFG